MATPEEIQRMVFNSIAQQRERDAMAQRYGGIGPPTGFAATQSPFGPPTVAAGLPEAYGPQDALMDFGPGIARRALPLAMGITTTPKMIAQMIQRATGRMPSSIGRTVREVGEAGDEQLFDAFANAMMGAANSKVSGTKVAERMLTPRNKRLFKAIRGYPASDPMTSESYTSSYAAWDQIDRGIRSRQLSPVRFPVADTFRIDESRAGQLIEDLMRSPHLDWPYGLREVMQASLDNPRSIPLDEAIGNRILGLSPDEFVQLENLAASNVRGRRVLRPWSAPQQAQQGLQHHLNVTQDFESLHPMSDLLARHASISPDEADNLLREISANPRGAWTPSVRSYARATGLGRELSMDELTRGFGIGSTLMRTTPAQIQAMNRYSQASPSRSLLNRTNFLQRTGSSIPPAPLNDAIAQGGGVAARTGDISPSDAATVMLTNASHGWGRYGPGIQNLMRDYAGGFLTTYDFGNRLRGEMRQMNPTALDQMLRAIRGFMR